MAKNYIQDGNTIHLQNAGAKVIASGAPVAVGGMIAVALVDIPPASSGTGATTGVFSLPKVEAEETPQGARVFLKDGLIQLEEAGAVAAGVVWEDAGAGTEAVAVKLNV
ncbi:DUF2190 family protein [Klebsiella sp. PL-2018]|uniref:DUF2190 family protein n=1 Tax=Klebsiella sp. PL-2018 TaxID=2851540 RepID=UPI001C240691|nr:capsid cement protein [Klebsiella sp. PL-2018]QXC99323.1 Phage protein [Klebsiella sp. PL-2018]